MIRVYIIAALLSVLSALGWYAHHRIYAQGYVAGQASMQAAITRAQDAAARATAQRDAAASTAGTDMLAYLSAQLPHAQTQTNEATEHVRTIYRDRPIPSVCVRPAGVQSELDAARRRANAAAGAVSH